MPNDPDIVSVETNYYQQFDADVSRDVPAEGLGGWKKAHLPLSRKHTALAVMHVWDTGSPEDFPGWHRCAEFLPRAAQIVTAVFPALLRTVRASRMKVFHVVSPGNYYQHLPGYQRARALAPQAPSRPEQIPSDPVSLQLAAFRNAQVSIGPHNHADLQRGFKNLNIPREVQPIDGEPIAETSDQLYALCKQDGINHLIYTGFAINWCLLLAPGGMADMHRHGILCSAIREAVTAVENKESARLELAKSLALWRVALAYGFIYDIDDFSRALQESP